MGEKKEKNVLPLGADLLESLAKFQQIELEDVELTFDELELRLSPGMVMGAPPAIPKPVAVRAKPAFLLEAEAGIPIQDYPGSVVRWWHSRLKLT